jgi:hypothetical protein
VNGAFFKGEFNRGTNMASITDRMIRAAKLDVNLYEEVEADKSAMGQAMAVVVLSSVAAGIGTVGTAGIKGLVLGTIVALVGWFIWAFLTYYIGTRLLPEPQTKADYGDLLRTIGFSSSPGVNCRAQVWHTSCLSTSRECPLRAVIMYRNQFHLTVSDIQRPFICSEVACR